MQTLSHPPAAESGLWKHVLLVIVLLSFTVLLAGGLDLSKYGPYPQYGRHR